MGTLSIPSIQGHRFFLTIVDDHSKPTWLYFMKSKSKASNLVKCFVAMIPTQYKTTLKCIRSDNGHEFNMRDFLAEEGIINQVSCVESPE
jgi:hypothetical protein